MRSPVFIYFLDDMELELRGPNGIERFFWPSFEVIPVKQITKAPEVPLSSDFYPEKPDFVDLYLGDFTFIRQVPKIYKTMVFCWQKRKKVYYILMMKQIVKDIEIDEIPKISLKNMFGFGFFALLAQGKKYMPSFIPFTDGNIGIAWVSVDSGSRWDSSNDVNNLIGVILNDRRCKLYQFDTFQELFEWVNE